MSYRAYYRVTVGDDGKPISKPKLQPVVVNLQAHVNEAFAEEVRKGYRSGAASVWVTSHLGKPTIRFEADEAWEVRVAIRVIDAFLKRTGWTYSRVLNANTSRAL